MEQWSAGATGIGGDGSLHGHVILECSDAGLAFIAVIVQVQKAVEGAVLELWS